MLAEAWWCCASRAMSHVSTVRDPFRLLAVAAPDDLLAGLQLFDLHTEDRLTLVSDPNSASTADLLVRLGVDRPPAA